MTKITLKKISYYWQQQFIYKNEIGEFNYIDIKSVANNVRNITVSEIFAKKDLNIVNEIKNTEIIKEKVHP